MFSENKNLFFSQPFERLHILLLCHIEYGRAWFVENDTLMIVNQFEEARTDCGRHAKDNTFGYAVN